jgi:hypothetical protein
VRFCVNRDFVVKAFTQTACGALFSEHVHPLTLRHHTELERLQRETRKSHFKVRKRCRCPKRKSCRQPVINHRSATRRFIIYRSGAGTPLNMTPRSTDPEGLSAFKEAPRTPGRKYQVIDTVKLNELRAFCDDDVTGHFCIVPQDMSRMQEWIDSRGKELHPFTEELLNAIVSQHRT